MVKIIKEEKGRKIWGTRGYETPAARARAIRQLMKRGVNYFVTYRDTAAPYAIQYTVCEWVTKGNIESSVGKGYYGPHTKERHHAYIH